MNITQRKIDMINDVLVGAGDGKEIMVLCGDATWKRSEEPLEKIIAFILNSTMEYKVKSEQEFVELGYDDVSTTDSFVNHINNAFKKAPLSVQNDGVLICFEAGNVIALVTWEALKKEWLWLKDGKWVECKKDKEC